MPQAGLGRHDPRGDARKRHRARYCDKSKLPFRCSVDPTTVVTCPVDTNVADCLQPVCNKLAGTCAEVARPDHAPCSDGDPCTAFDTCLGGACQSGAQAPSCKKLNSLRFAVIANYGNGNNTALAVASVVKAFKPAFVVTAGGNNFPDGTAATIDANVGKPYASFLKPYAGKFGPGSADVNRFWPVPGVEDWKATGLKPWLDYFTLPHVERYYDLVRGPVHLLMIDSSPKEPDGNKLTSKQAQWHMARAKAVAAPYRFAVMAGPPLSSSPLGPVADMQWPWRKMGVAATFAGRDRRYERLNGDRVWHIVTGTGGGPLAAKLKKAAQQSQVAVAQRYGAVLVDVNDRLAKVDYIDIDGDVLDRFAIAPHGKASAVFAETTYITKGATWRFHDKGQDLGSAWRQPAYDDSKWASGPGPFGYASGSGVKTAVSFGANPGKKHMTTYFRQAFTVGDPKEHGYLHVGLQRDDGAVVYLNGEEVWRDNMPAGPIGFATKAKAGSSSTSTYFTKDVPLTHLVKGKNVLAVEVHQVSGSSTDLAFDLRLLGRTKLGDQVFPLGSTWQYHDGAQPHSGWTSTKPSGNWKKGVGPFGYHSGQVKTKIGFGGNASNKHITAWFRRTFTVADASQVDYVRLAVKRDDGAVVYINGQEVWRANLPSGPIGPLTKAPVELVGDTERRACETVVDGAVLQDGTNVVAVEVHQHSANSSDLFFDLSLATFPK